MKFNNIKELQKNVRRNKKGIIEAISKYLKENYNSDLFSSGDKFVCASPIQGWKITENNKIEIWFISEKSIRELSKEL